jgi:hypothetical protein
MDSCIFIAYKLLYTAITIASRCLIDNIPLPNRSLHCLFDFSLCCLIDYCTGEDQAVILTGESGSGKTEAGKLVLQYIAAVTHHSAEFHNIKYQLLQSNPVLEGRQLFSASHP